MGGRSNQRQRTRKDLLQAAARLMKQGRAPSLDEVAAEAMVSRATAYRYFPNVETLLIEAPLEIAAPEAADVFRNAPRDDAVARMEEVDAAFETMMSANEAQLRMMLAHAVQAPLRDGEAPVRQNRRSELIEAALAPARKTFKPAELKMLSRALALMIGTEAMIVFKDVLRLSDGDARKARRWAIRAMIEAARK